MVVEGSAAAKEAVTRGGSSTEISKSGAVPETGPARFPSNADTRAESAALPAGEFGTTGSEKCAVAPGARLATDAGEGEPAPIGPETCAEGATFSAGVPPWF